MLFISLLNISISFCFILSLTNSVISAPIFQGNDDASSKPTNPYNAKREYLPPYQDYDQRYRYQPDHMKDDELRVKTMMVVPANIYPASALALFSSATEPSSQDTDDRLIRQMRSAAEASTLLATPEPMKNNQEKQSTIFNYFSSMIGDYYTRLQSWWYRQWLLWSNDRHDSSFISDQFVNRKQGGKDGAIGITSTIPKKSRRNNYEQQKQSEQNNNNDNDYNRHSALNQKIESKDAVLQVITSDVLF